MKKVIAFFLVLVISITISSCKSSKSDDSEMLVINTTSLNIGVGETTVLTISSYKNSDVTWSISDTRIANVLNGNVTALAEGIATITASTSNGKSALCNLTVYAKNETAYTSELATTFVQDNYETKVTTIKAQTTNQPTTKVQTTNQPTTKVQTTNQPTTKAQTTKPQTSQATQIIYTNGQTWTVDGQWEFTINFVKSHYKCNAYANNDDGDQVIIITYSYKSIGYYGDSFWRFDVYDEEGEAAKQYPCTHCDYDGYAIATDYSGAQRAYLLRNNSLHITLNVFDYNSNGLGNQKATFNLTVS